MLLIPRSDRRFANSINQLKRDVRIVRFNQGAGNAQNQHIFFRALQRGMLNHFDGALVFSALQANVDLQSEGF